jgi:hypothetical protein
MRAFPIGWRPKPSELIAIKRATIELGITRTQLLRTATAEWLQEQQRQGVLSKGTAAAFN